MTRPVVLRSTLEGMAGGEEQAPGRRGARRAWLRRPLRWLLALLVGVPVLLLATCIGREVQVSRELELACNGLTPGYPVVGAEVTGFESRSRAAPEATEDWFDREYRRIAAEPRHDTGSDAGLLVLFAKPGLGYYACIVEQRDGRVRSARYVDRSS